MFTIERETSDISESEFFEIFIKKRFPDTLNDIDHTDITTKIQGISKRMPSLTFIVIEVVNFEFIDFDFSPVFINHIWLYLTCIETNSRSESFENTSRLIR